MIVDSMSHCRQVQSVLSTLGVTAMQKGKGVMRNLVPLLFPGVTRGTVVRLDAGAPCNLDGHFGSGQCLFQTLAPEFGALCASG